MIVLTSLEWREYPSLDSYYNKNTMKFRISAYNWYYSLNHPTMNAHLKRISERSFAVESLCVMNLSARMFWFWLAEKRFYCSC
jgi:hypothetical protein